MLSGKGDATLGDTHTNTQKPLGEQRKELIKKKVLSRGKVWVGESWIDGGPFPICARLAASPVRHGRFEDLFVTEDANRRKVPFGVVTGRWGGESFRVLPYFAA